jgi:hypothetical protein
LGESWVEKSVLEGGGVEEVVLLVAVGRGLTFVYIKNLRVISDRFLLTGQGL